MNNKTNLHFSHLFFTLFMGFFSAIPLALTSSTLQAWYTEAGVNIVLIGFLTLVGMPYIWRFLWAPFMDRYTLPRLNRRKGWIAVAQFLLCLSLVLIAHVDPALHPTEMALAALFIAFFSASQDIAIDAYRTDLLTRHERGLGAAIYVFAYRVGMLVSGGMALILADHVGWQRTYEFMGILMGIGILFTYYSPKIEDQERVPLSLRETIVGALKEFWQKDRIGVIVLFVAFYKVGDALALSLMSNFLLHGLGFSLTTVGLAYKTLGFIATILGVFAGGAWLVSLNLYRALWYFGLAQAFSNLMFVFLALAGKNYVMLFAAISLEQFCSGLTTAALVAYLMSLCNIRYTATQFACLSALASLGRVLLGPLAAVMVKDMGWVVFFSWAFVLSFPGLILLSFLKEQVSIHEKMVGV